LGRDAWSAARYVSARVVEAEQRLPDGICHKPPHFTFLMKFHFALGRMDVDIHCGRIDFQKEAADREPPFHQRCVIPFQQRIIQPAVFHRPAIYKEVLILASSPGNARCADETP
jgi:hypothetical protein